MLKPVNCALPDDGPVRPEHVGVDYSNVIVILKKCVHLLIDIIKLV